MTKKNSTLFTSILYIVLGIILAVFPENSMSIAMTVAGIVFVVSGILEIIKNNVSGGIVSLIIGVAILALGWLLVDIVLLVLGILIIVKGVIALINVLKNDKPAVLDIIFATLTIVVGAVLALGKGIHWLVVIIGVILIVDGILGLVAELKK